MSAKVATFDPIDAPLWEAYDYYQRLCDDDRAAHYRHTFWVDPKHWKRHRPPSWVLQLKWAKYRYANVDDNGKLKVSVPDTRPGMYLFGIAPADSVFEHFPRYVFYVGISNDRDSHRPLRKRLYDYLPSQVRQIRKRKAVHKFLRLYFRDVWVYFAHTNRSSSSIKRAETKLHGYLAPPVAQAAYPVDMKPFRPAF